MKSTTKNIKSIKKAKLKESLEQSSKEGVRINKYLADAGICSRRKADDYISAGLVEVNGKTVNQLGIMIKPGDKVTLQGDALSERRHLEYILLNKPKDYITTTKDEKGRKTVMDIVRKRTRLFPVGRLDRNTTGVLLITNDGELANRLMHPKFNIERTYKISLDKKISSDDAAKIAAGMTIDDIKYSKCQIFIDPKNALNITVILNEGKNRELHKLFGALGYQIKKLDRKFYANLSTSGLKRGEYRHLTRKEVEELKNILKL